MKLINLVDFYINKEEHYEISDDFVMSGYQQKDGGYIERAKKENVDVNYKIAEPNQKWHLLCSYIPKLYFNDKKMSYNEVKNKCNEDIKLNIRSFNFLQCPELLLWMAEAAGIDKDLIIKASADAKKIIDEKGTSGRNAAGRIIWTKEPYNFRKKILDIIYG